MAFDSSWVNWGFRYSPIWSRTGYTSCKIERVETQDSQLVDGLFWVKTSTKPAGFLAEIMNMGSPYHPAWVFLPQELFALQNATSWAAQEVKGARGVQCGTEKLDTWQLWGTYILYMNYVSILVLRVYCRCGFLVSSRGETEFHVFVCVLCTCSSPFLSSWDQTNLDLSTMIFKKDPRSMLLQYSKGTWPWKIMEYASFRSIWFKFDFHVEHVYFPAMFATGNMIGLAGSYQWLQPLDQTYFQFVTDSSG